MFPAHVIPSTSDPACSQVSPLGSHLRLHPSPCLRCMSGLYNYFAGAQVRNLGAISDLPLPSASTSSQPPHPAHPSSLVAGISLLFIPILVTCIPTTFPPVSLAPCSPSSPLWLESSELKIKSYLNLLHDFA